MGHRADGDINARGLLEAGRSAFQPGRQISISAPVGEADSSALAVMLGWLAGQPASGQPSFANTFRRACVPGGPLRRRLICSPSSEGWGMTAAVSIVDVVKNFGALQALAGVSLGSEGGEFFGLLGPNGAGKTTLISTLAGLVRADSGRLSVPGHDVVRDYRAARLRVVPAGTGVRPVFLGTRVP